MKPMQLKDVARDPWVRAQFLLAGIIFLAAPLLTRINLGPLDPLFGMADPRWLRFLGAGMLLTGIGISWWGVRSLGPSLTPSVTPLEQGVLVDTGAYARVRHPIYTGMILLLTGYTLAWSNWRLALIVGLGTTLFFDRKAGAEESNMTARFPGYATYRRRVPKLWPWQRP